MGIISRGFSGRRQSADVKLPPGQYLTTDFPVLSAGPTPHVPLDGWEFTISDGANNGYDRYDYKISDKNRLSSLIVVAHATVKPLALNSTSRF